MVNKLLEKILKARVYDVAKETPLEKADKLSSRFKNNIFLKREDLQPVFSFKLRGAYNKLVTLNAKQRKAGVVAASAGNHAQGLALSGAKIGIKTHIVMPRTTPKIKVDAVRALGGRVILEGDTYDEAFAHAQSLVKKSGMTLIHPFDDIDVIAGQGTIGLELIRQHMDDAHAIFIPVGGGGLIAGIATVIKTLRPDIRIIGVEPEDAASMYKALKARRRITLDNVGLFADGVAVKQVGKETLKIAKKHVDEIILVKTDEMCAAIKDIFEDTRTVVEPAGALAVAGMKNYIRQHNLSAENLMAIVSGANINFDRLRHVSERAEIGEEREALLAVKIPEQPGSFLRFCKIIGKLGITEFNYRYADDSIAHVFAGVQLNGGYEQRISLLAKLQARGYAITDLTDHELSKMHLRYMVGGHASGIKNERIYRFLFPERPGALQDFLTAIGNEWNISLFHYRNHGAAYGRALVGIQIPKADHKKFQKKIDKLGYRYWDETNDPGYKIFLS